MLDIPDLHAPFEHPNAYAFLEKLANQWNVDEIVCGGDEMDCHAMSLKYAADPDGYSPGHEFELAIESLKKLYKIFPDVKVCTSNHTYRPMKMALAHGFPKIFMRRINEFMQAPKGWEWRNHWEIDKTRYIHGEPFSSGTWMRAHNIFRQSMVIHHVHAKAGVVYSNTEHSRVFSVNSGCLINPVAYAFAYGKENPEKPCLGASIIVHGKEAYWIPMPEQQGVMTPIAAGKLNYKK